MQNFSLHIDGQCLKSVTGFAQILFVKLKYIYLALICVLRANISFGYKTI